ncbi:MAG: porphobilinogen synthase [Rhodothalassiaceae bacterium]
MTHPFSARINRLRRPRATAWSRALVRETRMTPADLIWPLFVTAGDAAEPIAAMPGVERLPICALAETAKRAADLGIPALALFPNTPAERRSQDGAEALNPDNLVNRATAAIKDTGLDLGVIVDVALDPYTTHGHDGLMAPDGRILNDETVSVLAGQAVVQARAGADIVAPSDMMDGRVAAIRSALDAEGFSDVQIMAYSAKYASGFYGPFRDAVGSGAKLTGDKKTYQMDPANGLEAEWEVAQDVAEGADSLIVKPGMPYLDIVARVAALRLKPVFAYQVSGEYAMIVRAAEAGALDQDAAMLESLLAFKRAGAAGVLSYFAPQAAELLQRAP